MKDERRHAQRTWAGRPSSFRLHLAAASRLWRPSAFTLIELMIAIAMMVLLMLGVNFIFSSVGQATGTAQALSKAQRDAQAAQAIMSSDFSNIVIDGKMPCLQITSIVRPAFANRQDQMVDRDGDPSTWDQAGTGATPEPAVSPASISDRVHRLDLISFFARGNFPRQTGNDGVYVAPQKPSSEAWVWYGHLRVNSNGTFSTSQDPGQGSPSSANPSQYNPDNYLASQWKLGRVVMLLTDMNAEGLGSGTLNNGGGQILDKNNTAQGFIDRNWLKTDPITSGNHSLTPLVFSAGSNYTPIPFDPRLGATTIGEIESCRFDVAGTTIADYQKRLKDVIDAANQNVFTLDPIDGWWGDRFATDGRRFQCNPFYSRPLNSAAASQTVPILLESCSQFIVEYAGDFVAQDSLGNVTGWFGQGQTDKKIDFYIDPVTKAQHIQWYGMPRSTSGQPTICSANGDVVPLRDVLPAGAPATGAPFERFVPTPGASTDYIAGSQKLKFSSSNDTTYLCAWGPYDTFRPWLIRITIVLNDPNGRLKDGQMFQFVFKVSEGSN